MWRNRLECRGRRTISFINYSAREINLKIVYYGAIGAGAVENVEYVQRKSEPDVPRLMRLPRERQTEVHFDFSPPSLIAIRSFRVRFHLCAPNPNPFCDLRLRLKGVDGIVFVADSRVSRMEENIEQLERLEHLLASQGYDLGKRPLAIQYSHRDSADALPVPVLSTHLNRYGAPDFEANTETGAGVFDTLKAVAKLMLAEWKRSELHESHGAPPVQRDAPRVPEVVPAPPNSSVLSEAGRAGGIMISYCHDDWTSAGRLYDFLVQKFPEPLVFMDYESIPPGSDYMQHIRQWVTSSDVVLVIIGPAFVQPFSDVLIFEISTALNRSAPVIPILFGDTAIPQAAHLPDELRRLPSRQVFRLHHESFKQGAQTLAERLEGILRKAGRDLRPSDDGDWVEDQTGAGAPAPPTTR